MLNLLFTRRHHPGSWLIRAATWSEWSHVDLVRPDGSLIGAVALHGVSIADRGERLGLASAAAVMTLPVDIGKSVAWADGQIGRPYDWLGVIGIGLHRDWESDDSWFCSEFAGRALKEGGYEPYRPDALRRLTPQDLWRLNHPVEVVK